MLYFFGVNEKDSIYASEEGALQAGDAVVSSSKAGTKAPDGHEACLLAMGRAVQRVGMYGPAHPSSRAAVAEWHKALSLRLRLSGTFVVGTDGQVALVEGVPFSTTNPVILSLLRKLYTSRAGRLEWLSGFREEDALKLAAFLAAADEKHLAEPEHSIEAWIRSNTPHHVRVSQIRFREIQDGDRVVSGAGRAGPVHRSGDRGAKKRESLHPKEVTSWARKFEVEAKRDEVPKSLPGELVDEVVSHLRGLDGTQTVAMSSAVRRAAEQPTKLAELLLKVALVQHAVKRRDGQPIGSDIAECLESVVDALVKLPEAKVEEGLANLARTLDVLESRVLEQMSHVTGGGEGDEKIVREAVEKMQRRIEGIALTREYEQKRSALLAVERRVKRFFGVDDKPNAL